MTDKPRYPTPTEQAAMDARPGEPDASGAPEGGDKCTPDMADKQQQRHDYSDVLEAQAKIAEQKGHGGWAINMRQAARYLDAQAAEIVGLSRRADNQDRWARKYRAEAALAKQQNATLWEALKALRLAAHRHLSAMKAGSAVDIEFTKDELQSALAPFLKGTSDEQ